MKRLYEKFLLTIFAILWFTILVAAASWMGNLIEQQDVLCTPSQEQSQVIKAISGLYLQMSEKNKKCDFENNWLEIPTAYCKDEWTTENTCPIYCNSVSCWCNEEAYKERDKMDNNNPNKFMYIEEQWKKNYFDRTKIK